MGCQLAFNQKMKEIQDLVPVFNNTSYTECARECMVQDDCKYGWTYNTFSKEVKYSNINISICIANFVVLILEDKWEEKTRLELADWKIIMWSYYINRKLPRDRQ